MSSEALPEGVWRVLRCSFCGAQLERTDIGAECVGCGMAYRYADGGSLDLRLRRPRRYPLTFTVGEPERTETAIGGDPLRRRHAPAVQFEGIAIPRHLTAAILDRFPKAPSSSSLALDLGCGSGIHREVCEHAGFQWIGLDYAAEGAPIWGDGHALPFADDSFDFILTIAVLEHIRYPFVMLREAHRVLRPGGSLIGTVAFMEPFHGRSFYHHSDLGLVTVLLHAGFTIDVVAPHEDWTVLKAQARMALFPHLPARLADLIVAPVEGLHRLWWRLARLVSRKATRNLRLRMTTGAFTFVARKPVP